MAKLYDWYLTKEEYGDKEYVIAHGVVTGHVKLQDSDFIHTSAVQKVTVSDTGSVIILTMNTEFHCKMQGAKYDAFTDTTLIPGFDILKEKYPYIERDVYETDQDSILLVLGNNKQYYFGQMVRNKGGNYSLLKKACVHVGTFQDSVLIRNFSDSSFDNVNLCYFPYKDRCLEFYTWNEEIKVYIENCGDNELSVKVMGFMYRIKPGERKEIVSENAEIEIKKEEFTTVDLHDIWEDMEKRLKNENK